MLKTPMPTMNTSPPRTMKIPMKKPVPSSGVAMVAAVGSQVRWLRSVATKETCKRCFTMF